MQLLIPAPVPRFRHQYLHTAEQYINRVKHKEEKPLKDALGISVIITKNGTFISDK